MHFDKYQATGNDFIIVDQRSGRFDKTNHNRIKMLCDRRFGIGADGFMLLENDPEFDFNMVYFNSDGYEGSMCGNGGRCIAAYASEVLDIHPDLRFRAYDGPHQARILSQKNNSFVIQLSMKDVQYPEKHAGDLILDTGSPHYIRFVDDIENIDVRELGREVRYSSPFRDKGINVNFVQILNKTNIKVRTYERGVEDETLSCGTGVTASAIAAFAAGLTDQTYLSILSPGGQLKVSFSPEKEMLRSIFLEGEATKVFEGDIHL